MSSKQFDEKLAQQSSRADAQANSPSAIKEQFDLIRRVLTGTSYETTDLFRALLRDDFISENGRNVMLGWVSQVQSKKETPARNRVLIASFKSHDEIKEWASSNETQGVVFIGLKAYRNG